MLPLSIRTPPPPAHIQQRPTLTLTPPDAHPSIYPCTSIPTTSVGGDRRSIDHHLTTTPFFSSRVLAHNHTTRRHTTTQRNDAAGVRGIPPPPFPPISHLLPTPPRMQQRTNGSRPGAKATGSRVLGVTTYLSADGSIACGENVSPRRRRRRRRVARRVATAPVSRCGGGVVRESGLWSGLVWFGLHT